MRFVLNDDAKADKKRIENISTTKGMFTNAGQFQVIIGNDVATFYNDFSAVSGIEGVSKEAAKSAAKSNQNVIQKLVGTLSEIFTPLLPAIIVGGLILGFRNILEGSKFKRLVKLLKMGLRKSHQKVYQFGILLRKCLHSGMVSTVSSGYLVKRFSTSYQLGLLGQ